MDRPKGCCFCGGKEGRPYLIQPFGYACQSCTDSFFSSRTSRGWTKLDDATIRKALAESLGPPYRGVAVKIDVRDTGGAQKVVTAGYLCPDRAAGLGVYVYTGQYQTRVFMKARAPGDEPRPRLNWHVPEWRRVARSVGYVIFRQHAQDPKTPTAFFLITMARALELSRHYDTPNGKRCGPPIEACTHYGPDWTLVRPPANLETLTALANI